MKVKQVVANHRKKTFEVVLGQKTYSFPFSKLTLKPSEKDRLQEVFPDPEIGLEGFTYRLASGKEGTVLVDQILEYSKDPEYMRQRILFDLSVKAQDRIQELGVSKREIIRRMGTTPTQFYRLLDQKNTSKTIDQMVKLLAALDYSIGLVFKDAA